MTERPLLVRQIDALKHWLEKPRWTAREAACLLVGVLPPVRGGDNREFGAWLPGKEAWENARDAWRFEVSSEIDHIEAVLDDSRPFRGRTPRHFLVLAAVLGIAPPWLQAAREDANCSALLPNELLGEGQRHEVDAPVTVAANARKAANIRHRNDTEAEEMRKARQERAKELKDLGKGRSETASILEDEFEIGRSTAYEDARKVFGPRSPKA